MNESTKKLVDDLKEVFSMCSTEQEVLETLEFALKENKNCLVQMKVDISQYVFVSSLMNLSALKRLEQLAKERKGMK